MVDTGAGDVWPADRGVKRQRRRGPVVHHSRFDCKNCRDLFSIQRRVIIPVATRECAAMRHPLHHRAAVRFAAGRERSAWNERRCPGNEAEAHQDGGESTAHAAIVAELFSGLCGVERHPAADR